MLGQRFLLVVRAVVQDFRAVQLIAVLGVALMQAFAFLHQLTLMGKLRLALLLQLIGIRIGLPGGLGLLLRGLAKLGKLPLRLLRLLALRGDFLPQGVQRALQGGAFLGPARLIASQGFDAVLHLGKLQPLLRHLIAQAVGLIAGGTQGVLQFFGLLIQRFTIHRRGLRALGEQLQIGADLGDAFGQLGDGLLRFFQALGMRLQFGGGVEHALLLAGHGNLLLMLPHEKYVYHSGHTGIPIGHFCPMEVSPRLHENMLRETEKIIRATGMDNCAINIDAMILPDESVSIIEAAGRCGATGIPEVISGYTGRDYYSCIIDAALGRPIAPFDLTHGTPTASQLLYTERSGILREIRYRFAGREYVNANAVVPGKGKVELSFAPGDDIDAFRNGTDRIGQAIFQAASNDELQAAVKAFRESLRVEVCQ